MRLRRWVVVGGLGLAVAGWAQSGLSAPLVIEAEMAPVRTAGDRVGDVWNLHSPGRVGGYLSADRPVRVELKVTAYGSPLGGEWPWMDLTLDGVIVAGTFVAGERPVAYRFSLMLPAGVTEVAVGFTNDAVSEMEDRNLYVDKIAIALAKTALETSQPPLKLASPTEFLAAFQAREQRTLAATRDAIARHRQGPVIIRVTTPEGRPAAGVKIDVKLTRHAFLFGCNFFEFKRHDDPAKNEQYEKHFEELFNYATLPFYWRGYEWRRGQPDYAKTEAEIAWLAARGIRMKGHPILWGHEAGEPPWAGGQPSPDQQRARVADLLTRFRQIEFWEVVNEPSHIPQPKIDAPYRWAREANGAARLIVNDYHVLTNGRPEFFRLIARAQENDVPIDAIGMQAHEPRDARLPLARVKRVLDKYAELGLPIHITEFTPTTDGRPVTDHAADVARGAVWNEATQAEYAEQFYRVCFAHPSVAAITWWDLHEGEAWLAGGGLLRKDFSQKPAYNRLKNLIHQEWTTHTTVTTDETGIARFRGFFGEYQVTVQDERGTASATRSCAQDGENVWHIRLTSSR